MLANIIEIFQNIWYHVDLHFTLRRREFVLNILPLSCFAAEGYSEPLQTSKMKCFMYNTPVFKFHLVMICHHNKHLMEYFKFLHGSTIFCLHLNVSEKSH